MELKKLEVPTTSITEVKKSPMDVFQQARDSGTGVYVFNREKVAGVMMTQVQYEELLEELATLRLNRQQPNGTLPESSSDPLTSEFVESIRTTIAVGTSITMKQIDERMVSLGFITKKTGFGGINELMNELQTTGKVIYQLRKRNQGAILYVELIGEPDHQSQLLERVIIKKILARQVK